MKGIFAVEESRRRLPFLNPYKTIEPVILDPCVLFKNHLKGTPYEGQKTLPFFNTHIHREGCRNLTQVCIT